MECLSHRFCAAQRESTFMCEIDVMHISFSASLVFTPPKDIFLEMAATVFYKLVYLPILLGVFHLYYTLYSLYLYVFHPPELQNMQTSSFRPTHTLTHIIPANRYIFVNTTIRKSLSRQIFPFFSIFVHRSLWGNPSHSKKICCAGSLHFCVFWVDKVETALFMMQVIGTKQRQEQPLISERSNQTQSQRY